MGASVVGSAVGAGVVGAGVVGTGVEASAFSVGASVGAAVPQAPSIKHTINTETEIDKSLVFFILTPIKSQTVFKLFAIFLFRVS